MSRKRRRRSFRGTPEEHRAAARWLAREIKTEVPALKKAIAKGDCELAFRRLNRLHAEAGAFGAERSWVAEGGAMHKSGLTALTHHFAQKCLR